MPCMGILLYLSQKCTLHIAAGLSCQLQHSRLDELKSIQSEWLAFVCPLIVCIARYCKPIMHCIMTRAGL